MSSNLSALAFCTIAALVPLSASDTAQPSFKWRGSIWTLGTQTDRAMADGNAFLRPLETSDSQFSVDGLLFGLDLSLCPTWSVKASLMAGRDGKLFQDFSGENGAMGFPEAMLIWTGASDTVRIGRMWTSMGMESTDLTAATPASHGLIATFVNPFGQVGLEWRHAWNPSWSNTVWVYNGEDQNIDKNRGKTIGLGASYTHAGDALRFLNFMVFSGPEQDGKSSLAHSGAEGRRRDRFSHNGQWTWGSATLAWEFAYIREPFPINGTQESNSEEIGNCLAMGTVFKYLWGENWSGFVRAEEVKDDLGFRLNFDPMINARYGMTPGIELKAHSASVGLERRWGATFVRAELRKDWLNRDALDQDGKSFRTVGGITICIGTSFGQQ